MNEDFLSQWHLAKANAWTFSEYCDKNGNPCPHAIGGLLKRLGEGGEGGTFSATGAEVTLQFTRGARKGESVTVDANAFLNLLQQVFTRGEGSRERKLDLTNQTQAWTLVCKQLRPRRKKILSARDPKRDGLATGFGYGGSMSQFS
jgi:hypothetical protein